MIWGYLTHQVDVEQVIETETELRIELRTPIKDNVAGIMSAITFVLIPYLLVFLGLKYFGLIENIIARIMVILVDLVVILIILGLLVRIQNYYACPQALIVFDKQSGMMTVRLGRLGKNEKVNTLTLADIRAVVFVRLLGHFPKAQLLLERTDGGIVSIELDAFAPITASKNQSQVEAYEQVAQRIHRFLDLLTPVRSVVRDDVWRGESKLSFDTPASEPTIQG